MRKNKKSKGSLFFFVVFGLVSVPGILHAALPQPLNFVEQLAGLLPLYMLFWPIAVVAISTMSKVWLLRGKLAVPWKLKPLEKLCIGALAQSIVEFIFLTLLWALFAPVVAEVLGKTGFKAASPGVKTILHTALVIPWYGILATLSLLLLLQLITSFNFEELRQRYLKTGVFLSLILPVLIILIIGVRILFFK